MQACQASGPRVASIALASEVADAQPAGSEAPSSLHSTPQLPAAAVLPDAHANSSSSQSDMAAPSSTVDDDLEQDSKAGLKAGGQEEVMRGALLPGEARNQDDAAARAQRVAFAKAILTAFDQKLSGKDSSAKEPLSVQEHVDHLIKQATSLDNLSQMYEGWTAWI